MNALLNLRVPLDICAAASGTGACADDATLRVFFEDCPPCREAQGLSTCGGHGCCERHAAEARLGKRRSYVDGSRLVIARIRTNTTGAA